MAGKSKKQAVAVSVKVGKVAPKKKKSRKPHVKAAVSTTSKESKVYTAIPAALGMVKKTQMSKKRTLRFDGYEPLPSFQSTNVAADCQTHYVFQPGTTGLGQLDQIAGCFEQYRLVSLQYIFDPARGTNTSGRVVMAVDFDPSDSYPSGEVVAGSMMNTLGTLQPKVIGSVWQSFSLDIPVSEANRGKWMYTSYGGGYHPDLGAALDLIVGCETQAVGTVGTVFAKYVVEFANPVAPSNITGQSLGSATANYNATMTLGVTYVPSVAYGDKVNGLVTGVTAGPNGVNPPLKGATVFAADGSSLSDTYTISFPANPAGRSNGVKGKPRYYFLSYDGHFTSTTSPGAITSSNSTTFSTAGDGSVSIGLLGTGSGGGTITGTSTANIMSQTYQILVQAEQVLVLTITFISSFTTAIVAAANTFGSVLRMFTPGSINLQRNAIAGDEPTIMVPRLAFDSNRELEDRVRMVLLALLAEDGQTLRKPVAKVIDGDDEEDFERVPEDHSRDQNKDLRAMREVMNRLRDRGLPVQDSEVYEKRR